MIYLLGLFIAALWGVSLIAVIRSEELSTVDQHDLLNEFGSHFEWLGAIEHVPANELNKIRHTRCRSKEMTDDVINQEIEYSHSPGRVDSLIPSEAFFSGAYAV